MHWQSRFTSRWFSGQKKIFFIQLLTSFLPSLLPSHLLSLVSSTLVILIFLLASSDPATWRFVSIVLGVGEHLVVLQYDRIEMLVINLLYFVYFLQVI